MENSYKLASHDTFTYLPVSNFLGKLFKWAGKCQNKTVTEQIVERGSRMVDIRIDFDKNERPRIAHGIIKYKCSDVYDLFREISRAQQTVNEPVYCRMMLEIKNISDTDREAYRLLCQKVETLYPNIFFFGGMARYDWSDVVYDFGRGNMSDKIDEQISSVQGIGIWPWAWAKLNNPRILEEGTTKDFLMIDFI